MRRARPAFTLLEVLVAVAVLAFGIVGVLQLTMQSQSRTRGNLDRAIATRLAESKLTETALDPELTPGQDEGRFEDDGERFGWTRQVTNAETEGLLSVRVSVTWGRADRQQGVDLSTCLAPGVIQTTPAEPSAEAPAPAPDAQGASGAPPGGPGLPSSNSSSPSASRPSFSGPFSGRSSP